MFCVGLFVTLTSVVRLQSLIRFRKTVNFTWDYVGASYMSTLEAYVGVICACMPAIQLFLRRFAPRLFGSTADAGSYLQPHTGSRIRTRTLRNSHGVQPKNITKTITTTVTDIPKDSDSVIELVDADRQYHANGNADGSSFATVSTEHLQKSQ